MQSNYKTIVKLKIKENNMFKVYTIAYFIL